MIDYYENWKNELISFSGNLDKYHPETKRGTRGSLGLDISREYYEKLQRVKLDLIRCGAIKSPCIDCKSIGGTYNFDTGIWTCDKCGQTWDPQRLHYYGI